MNDTPPKMPNPGMTHGEMLTFGCGLGAGWRASKMIQAGARASAGSFISIGAAAGTGLFAAGVAGWNLRKIIGETEGVKESLSQVIEWALDDQNKNSGTDRLRAPAIDKELPPQAWHYEDTNGNSSDVWFFVSGDDRQERFAANFNDGGIDVYSNPFEAMDIAQEIGLIGQGNEMTGLYLDYMDVVANGCGRLSRHCTMHAAGVRNEIGGRHAVGREDRRPDLYPIGFASLLLEQDALLFSAKIIGCIPCSPDIG